MEEIVMGLIDFIRKQFIDVIEWTEPVSGILAYRYPLHDAEIQTGAQLTVRESQMALFVNEGQIADQFGPGLFTLNTHTLPVLTHLKNWDKFFALPFKSDVFFFSTRLQTDQKWGTATPITIRDKELGPIGLRAYGIYSYQLTDPKLFYTKVSGPRERYTIGDLEGQLQSILLTVLASLFGESAVNFIDMAANQIKFSEKIALALAPEFTKLGLRLENLLVQSIALPPELQAHFDEKAALNIVGDLKNYAQFQTAGSTLVTAVNLGDAAASFQSMSSAIASGENPLDTLEKLHELLKKGVITQSDFDAKKAELLKKIS